METCQVYKTKKLPEGVKQGPSLFQHFQATALGHEVKADGHHTVSVGIHLRMVQVTADGHHTVSIGIHENGASQAVGIQQPMH